MSEHDCSYHNASEQSGTLTAIDYRTRLVRALAKDSTRFDASLSGYEELPTLSTRGNGTFEASLNKDGSELHYTLSYEGPFDGNATGTPSNVTQAHIHFGARAFSGGISAFLCTNLGNGPAGTPACPATSGTVSGRSREAGFGAASDTVAPYPDGTNAATRPGGAVSDQTIRCGETSWSSNAGKILAGSI